MRDHSTPTVELSQQSSQSGEPPLRATEWSRPLRQEVRDVTAAAGVTDAATVHRALLPASSLATAERRSSRICTRKRRTGAARVLARSQSLARPQSWHGAGPGRAARELQEQHAKSAATRHAERAWTYVAS